MTKKERLAYLAGIIDGEAYVGIKKSTWGQRNRDDVKSPTYHERVQIRMNCKEILEIFKEFFGGSFYAEKKVYQSENGFKSNKIMTVYSATDMVAAKIIQAVRPYLIEKAKQADAILALRKSKESPEGKRRGGPVQKREMSPEMLVFRESLYLMVKALHN